MHGKRKDTGLKTRHYKSRAGRPETTREDLTGAERDSDERPRCKKDGDGKDESEGPVHASLVLLGAT